MYLCEFVKIIVSIYAHHKQNKSISFTGIFTKTQKNLLLFSKINCVISVIPRQNLRAFS
jgi:hypothetical protein